MLSAAGSRVSSAADPVETHHHILDHLLMLDQRCMQLLMARLEQCATSLRCN